MNIFSGCFARRKGTKEVLNVLAVDGSDAWISDDAGNKATVRVADLERVGWMEGARYMEQRDRLHNAAMTAREQAYVSPATETMILQGRLKFNGRPVAPSKVGEPG